jgi:hypothetical protein
MKKISLVTSLLLCTLPIVAHADWIKLGGGKGSFLYLDPTKTASIDSITKRAVILLSYEDKQQVPNREPYQSSVNRIETECRAYKFRFVANFYYSEEMGKGDLTFSSNIPLHEQEWIYPAPNSAIESALNQICSKR